MIDTFAVLATLFGLATSLGLGASQINAGLSLLLGVEDGFAIKFAIIAVATVIASVSVIRGLNGGIKVLSNFNMEKSETKFWLVNISEYDHRTMGLR